MKMSAQTMRRIDQLEGFVQQNASELRQLDKCEIYALFAGQFLNSNRAESTLHELLNEIRTFGVDPWNTEPARERVRLARLIAAIRQERLNRGRIFVRKVSVEPLPHVTQSPPDSKTEQYRMAYWALICVTGNRAYHLTLIRDLKVHDDRVEVHWGRRKVRSNVNCVYPFEWTARPPEWILDIWRRPMPIWPWPTESNMASAVRAWLLRWKSSLTASSPREKLDKRLIQLVMEGKLHPAVYETLIDHTMETHVSSYNQGVESTSSNC